MYWYFFKSQPGSKQYKSNQGQWYLKYPKNRPDSVFSPHRQLEDLWSQVCTLNLAKVVGIHVPEVFMVVPFNWDTKAYDDQNKIRISASIFSNQLDEFSELSDFYNQLSQFQSPQSLYDKSYLYLDLLSKVQKNALGKLYATALWLGHWDLANNVNFANAGFVKAKKSDQSLPAMVDGGNALDEGFNGYTKLSTISLFVKSDKENDHNHQEKEFDAIRFGYGHLAPLNNEIYPFLPRFLFNQKEFFWSDEDVIEGFVQQAKIIGQVKKIDIKECIRQCWQYVVDADGLHHAHPVGVLKKSLRLTQSRWSHTHLANSIIDVISGRAKNLNKMAKKVSKIDSHDFERIHASVLDHGRINNINRHN